MSFKDTDNLFPKIPIQESKGALPGQPQGNDYSKTAFMVVDDQEAARRSLRLSIQGMGGFLVSFCASHGDALRRVRDATAPPEIILCDYDLGPGRDGQQLLEELRQKKMIPQSTIFIMVTAERYYEKVVSVVELAPDDYLLKPFTPNQLHLRIDRLVTKKQFFGRFFRLQDAEDYDAAIAELDKLRSQKDSTLYKFDILRKKSETLLLARRFVEAINIYNEIIAINPFLWAQAGLAKAYFEQGEMTSARNLIDEVVAGAPKYFSAFDLKANICTQMGDHVEAQKTLEYVCLQNARNFARKMSLAESASYAGDLETAKKAIADIVANNTDATLSDMLQLARIAAVSGDRDLSGRLLESVAGDARKSMSEDEAISFASTSAMLGNDREFVRMRRTILARSAMSVSLGLDIVNAAMACQDMELALTVAKRLMSNDSTKKAFRALHDTFMKHGHGAEFKRVQNESARALIQSRLKNEGS